jgi:hypothetical protein
MRKLVLLIVIISSIGFAQKHNAGIFFDYQALFVSDVMQFRDLSETAYTNQCDCFEDPLISSAFNIGLNYSYKINSFINAGAKIGMSFNNIESSYNLSYPVEVIVRDPNTNEIIDRYFEESVTKQRSELDFTFFTFEPYAEFNLFSNFKFIAGPSLYFMTSDNLVFDYSIVSENEEKFNSENLEPGAVLSPDGRKITYYDGEIPNKNSFSPGVFVGFNYDIYYEDFIFSPEAHFRYNFTHLSGDGFWLVHHLNIGISVQYAFDIE